MSADVKVTLLGRSHAVAAPPSIIEQEELYLAWRDARKSRGGRGIPRAAAALVGMCTRIGREAGVSYAECGCDPVVYGGRIYDWLRTQPNGVDGLVAAADAISPVLMRALVALQGASKQADFSGPRGAV